MPAYVGFIIMGGFFVVVVWLMWLHAGFESMSASVNEYIHEPRAKARKEEERNRRALIVSEFSLMVAKGRAEREDLIRAANGDFDDGVFCFKGKWRSRQQCYNHSGWICDGKSAQDGDDLVVTIVEKGWPTE